MTRLTTIIKSNIDELTNGVVFIKLATFQSDKMRKYTVYMLFLILKAFKAIGFEGF